MWHKKGFRIGIAFVAGRTSTVANTTFVGLRGQHVAMTCPGETFEALSLDKVPHPYVIGLFRIPVVEIVIVGIST